MCQGEVSGDWRRGEKNVTSQWNLNTTWAFLENGLACFCSPICLSGETSLANTLTDRPPTLRLTPGKFWRQDCWHQGLWRSEPKSLPAGPRQQGSVRELCLCKCKSQKTPPLSVSPEDAPYTTNNTLPMAAHQNCWFKSFLPVSIG